MRRVRQLQLILAAALLPASPSVAQTPPTQGGQSVTVTGERESSEAQRRGEASRFFDSHAVRTRIGQLARWHGPICVRVGGLPPELNARIATRVMDIAAGVGVATNRAELCAPNVRIGFTNDPQGMVERAVRRNHMVIGFHYAARRRDLMRIRQSVQAWYVTTTMSGGGAATSDGVENQTEVIDQANVRIPGGTAGSRLSHGIASGLAHVMIFADTRIVAGEDSDAIAELLAYLALAQTPAAGACAEADTILNLANPACPAARRPTALTRQDIAYLGALYGTDPSWAPTLQRGSIVLDMANRLGGGR